MRTKLIIGLTTGLITAAQMGSAQTVSTVTANDEIFGNIVVGYAEVMTAPVVKLQQDVSVAATASVAPQEVTLTDASVFRHTEQASSQNLSSDFSVNSPEKTAAVAFALSSIDSDTQPTFTKRSYLDFGTGYSYPTLPALNQLESVSGSFAQASFADVSVLNTRENAEVDPMRASVSHSGSGTAVPMVAAPEPGTLGLLFAGGSALVSRLMFRRKKN